MLVTAATDLQKDIVEGGRVSFRSTAAPVFNQLSQRIDPLFSLSRSQSVNNCYNRNSQ